MAAQTDCSWKRVPSPSYLSSSLDLLSFRVGGKPPLSTKRQIGGPTPRNGTVAVGAASGAVEPRLLGLLAKAKSGPPSLSRPFGCALTLP